MIKNSMCRSVSKTTDTGEKVAPKRFKVIKAAWQEKIFRKINDLIVDISQLLRHTQARLEFFITINRF